MKYIALFVFIQLVTAVLAIIGLPICAALAYGRFYKRGKDGLWHWPKAFWLFDNDEDGVCPVWYATVKDEWSMPRVAFVWTALRNSVNNFRYVRGVSKPGRPLWYWSNGKHYAKAGWEAKTGWPSLSAGAGRGF